MNYGERLSLLASAAAASIKHSLSRQGFIIAIPSCPDWMVCGGRWVEVTPLTALTNRLIVRQFHIRGLMSFIVLQIGRQIKRDGHVGFRRRGYLLTAIASHYPPAAACCSRISGQIPRK
jgi:hypothetical protein